MDRLPLTSGQWEAGGSSGGGGGGSGGGGGDGGDGDGGGGGVSGDGGGCLVRPVTPPHLQLEDWDPYMVRGNCYNKRRESQDFY